jgi:spore coat protein A
MAWPNFDVAKGEYEFRALNGSDSRFYVLKLDNPNVTVTLVGTDGGLLPTAKTIIDGDGVQEDGEFLLLAPGDRAELVFDFSKLQNGDTVKLENVGPAYEPFKGVTDDAVLLGGAEAAGADDPVGNIMQFTVATEIKALDVKVTDGTTLAPVADLAKDADGDGIADVATHTRMVGLFEGEDRYGRVTPMLGTAEEGKVHSSFETADGAFGPLDFDAPATERPVLGTTEDWQIFNFTADSHPIHLHLTQYQVVEKRQIDFQDADEDGIPDDTNGDGVITYGNGTADFTANDIWIGDTISLRPEEDSWQDTVHVDPGTMMSIVAPFDKPGEYVWHCHILSHEDNEMMRPIVVDQGAIF